MMLKPRNWYAMRICWKKRMLRTGIGEDSRRIGARVASELTIPVIGIGAGGDVDGQVLVVQDMLGMNNGFRPRFLRRYADLHTVMTDAISRYVSDVKNLDFPNEKEQY